MKLPFVSAAPFSRPAPALILCGLLFVAGCDSTDTQEQASPLAGVWTGSAPVEWTRTYVLPEGGAVDSVRYEYTGTHTFGLDLREEGGTVTGTAEWGSTGTYTVARYDGPSLTVVDDDTPTVGQKKAVLGTFSRGQLTFPLSANDWIRGAGPVELALTRGDLIGEVLHTYLVQEWIIDGTPSRVQTRFEFPFPLRLERQGR